MAVTGKKKKGGGKLTRSQTVTVRFDPKLRYIAELAARTERRTLSSFVEWAVESYVSQLTVKDHADDMAEKRLVKLKDDLWDADDIKRLVLLGIHCPELLSYEEELKWKIISEEEVFWVNPKDFSEGVNYSNVYEAWEIISSYAEGELTRPQVISKLRKFQW